MRVADNEWGWGSTDGGHFLQSVDQDVSFVSICSLQLYLRDDGCIHSSVLGMERRRLVQPCCGFCI